jgi:hypothetical protein
MGCEPRPCARLHVSRAKNGIPSVHPLTGTELRALRRASLIVRFLLHRGRRPYMTDVVEKGLDGRCEH